MGLSEFLAKKKKQFVEYNKPENVQKRLMNKIKQAKLKDQLEEIQSKRTDRKKKKGIGFEVGFK